MGSDCRDYIIRLSGDDYNKLRELSERLGVSEESLVSAFVDALWIARGVARPSGTVRVTWEELSLRLARLLEYGYMMDRLVEGFLSRFDGEGLGYALEDAGWLEGFEGVYFVLVKSSGGSPWVDSVSVQLQSRGWAYAGFESLVGFRGELEDYDGVVSRLKKSLEEYLETDEYSSLEDKWEDCADYTEVEFRVESEEDSVRLVGEVYVSDWSCLPPLSDMEKIFESVFKRAGLEGLRDREQ